jgi:CRP/FNR family transcriptional regulator, cyclic AMP receptor protein
MPAMTVTVGLAAAGRAVLADVNEAFVDDGRRLLQACGLFRGLDDNTRRQLVSRSHRRRYAAGEIIFRIGSPGQSMIAVLAGTVRVTVPSAQGKEIVLAELGAGDVCGEIALLDGKERSADAAALTNCDLLVLERRDMLSFIEQHPEVALKLLAVLCERLRQTDEQIAEIAFLELPVRLAKALLRASRNSPRPAGSRQEIKLGLSQRALASMIGGTRESVNRCLRDWHRRGVIRLREGWIIIAEPDALEEISKAG